MKRFGRTAIAVGIVVALLVLGFANNDLAREAQAATVVTAASTTVSVTATSTFSYTPAIINEVPVSGPVTVKFTNGDTNGLIHTFTIIGCRNITIPRSGPDAYDISLYVNGSRCGAPLLNIVPAAQGEKSKSLTSTPAPGWYEYICTEPGHFQSGMYGFIAFDAIVPANLTPASGTPGAGAAVFIIVGTIVTLTVIAIVLGFVIGRREGSKHEMPPERLGYPEPGAPPLQRPPTPPSPPH